MANGITHTGLTFANQLGYTQPDLDSQPLAEASEQEQPPSLPRHTFLTFANQLAYTQPSQTTPSQSTTSQASEPSQPAQQNDVPVEATAESPKQGQTSSLGPAWSPDFPRDQPAAGASGSSPDPMVRRRRR